MKIKNILKIGVLSIILLSLLISPILKSNSPQVKAATPDAATAEFCKKYSTINLPDYAKEQKISEVAAKAEYVKRCCAPGYDWGADQQLINNRCDTLSGGVELAVEMGATTEVTGTAKELKATEVCSWLIYNKAEPDSGVWSMLTGDEDDLWWSHKVCTFQIGALEGIGKMIAGMINSLTAQIFWALDPDTYGGFVKNEGVVEIWEILKNYMNLALILILIIIAISTILGIKKYRWQEILWKLVLIALLINFSLILPGVLLDISHFITYTFINLTQDLNDNESIAQTVMNLYLTDEISGPEKYSASYGDTMGTIKVGGKDIKIEKEGWGLAWGNFFLVLAALALIGLFAFMSLIAIFFVMMFRSFIIIILLAVSPIAFAAWILPNTQKFWELWWGQFTRWCLFPITFAVSLYAGIIVLNGMHTHLAKMGASNEKLGIIAMLVQIILFSMFLIGGLIVSIQSTGAVGKVVQKQVSRTGWLAGSLIGKKTIHGVQGTKVYRDVGQQLTHVPVVSKIGFDMLDKSDQARITTDIRKREKDMENRGKEEIKDIANSATPNRLNKEAYTDHMAARNIAIKKGWLKNDDNALTEIRKDIQKNNPDLDAVAIRNAFPQYFRIGKDGKLEELNTKDRDYTKQVVNNLRNISADKMPKDTENIVKAVQDADKDVGELFQELISLKTNQIRAFFDNVSEKEYTQGELFGGKANSPKPWTGYDGEISKTLRTRLSQAQTRADDATKLSLYDSQGYEDPNVRLEQEESEQELKEIQNAIKTLEGKLKSPTLKETMGTDKIT